VHQLDYDYKMISF